MKPYEPPKADVEPPTPPPHHRRHYAAAAFLIAVVATVIGLSQTLYYYEVPLIPLALWFPTVVIFKASNLEGFAVSLIQFPFLATVFVLGVRRWRAERVVIVLMVTYALLVAIALPKVLRELREREERVGR